MLQPSLISLSQPVSSFDRLVTRIYRQVNSSAAQMRRRTVIYRLSEERSDDWDRLLEHLNGEESVRLLPLGDGTIQLIWTNQHPG